MIGYRDYEPFGAPLSAKQEKTRLGFIDKEQDKESSLADHGVRKYDYETGRFISCDALWGKYLGWSPYLYSANNPLCFIDVNGKELFPINLTNVQNMQLNRIPQDIYRVYGNSPTVANVMSRALGPARIDFYAFSENDVSRNFNNPSVINNDNTTCSRNFQDIHLEQRWVDSKGEGLALTIRNQEDNQMVSDVLFPEEGLSYELYVTDVLLGFIDEMNHSTTIPKQPGAVEHYNLFFSLTNEIELGILKVDFGTKNAIEKQCKSYQVEYEKYMGQ